MAMKLNDIKLLSDEQLYEKLLECKENIGPVVESTRAVYQIMLFNKLNEKEEITVLDEMGIVLDSAQTADITKTEQPVEENSRRSTSKAPLDLPTYFERQSPTPSNPSPHTFQRWSDADDSFGSPLFEDAVSFRSRRSLSARTPLRLHETVIASSVKKEGSFLKIVLLLAFVFVLAFVLLVVTQSPDPYKNIEAEASKFAGKLGNEAAV